MLHKVSQKSFFIKAIYDWCTECGYAPQLLVYYHPSCVLPKEFIDADNEVAFNISWEAVRDLKITPEYVSFEASFDGGMTGQQVFIPMPCIRGIYEGENADGMMFDLAPDDLDKLETEYQNKIINQNQQENAQKSQKLLFKRIK
jgi:stringent starvation protein B